MLILINTGPNSVNSLTINNTLDPILPNFPDIAGNGNDGNKEQQGSGTLDYLIMAQYWITAQEQIISADYVTAQGAQGFIF